ncbi:hypothetical protein HN51_069836 [Arachis hypogaea]
MPPFHVLGVPLASLKSKVVRNKMAAAGEAIDYKCLILFTNGKKIISTSDGIGDLGFWIGTIAMLLGIIIFAAALPLYRIHPAKGTSALLEIVQVYVAAIRNRRLTVPEDPTELYAIEQDREATLETKFSTS